MIVVEDMPKPRYTHEDHASLIIYLLNYPIQCYAVAQSLGYSGKAPGEKLEPDDADMNSWYIGLLMDYWIASQPPNKRSGSRDAAIRIDHVHPAVPTLGDLVQEIASEVGKNG